MRQMRRACGLPGLGDRSKRARFVGGVFARQLPEAVCAPETVPTARCVKDLGKSEGTPVMAGMRVKIFARKNGPTFAGSFVGKELDESLRAGKQMSARDAMAQWQLSVCIASNCWEVMAKSWPMTKHPWQKSWWLTNVDAQGRDFLHMPTQIFIRRRISPRGLQ